MLLRIFLTRPVTVTMCLVALLGIGLVSHSRIPIRAFASGLDGPQIYVYIPTQPNISPREKDLLIGRPLTEHFRNMKNLQKFRIRSDKYATSAELVFQRGVDMTDVYNRVVDRVESMKQVLPEEIRHYVFVFKYDRDADEQILGVDVTVPRDAEDMYYALETWVQPRLERLDGVAGIRIYGPPKKVIKISVYQERLQARGLTTHEIVRTLRADNFEMSGGTVHEGGRKFYVRSVARFQSVDEIENLAISAPGGVIRLKEVASVVYDVPLQMAKFRMDGQSAVYISVHRASEANIVELCDRVEAELMEIEADTDFQFSTIYNQGNLIRKSIENLQNTALWGGLLAALVLLFFLRSARMTALITLAIPLCVMIAVTVLYFMDWSLNLLTMMGLMIAVGMVVDNAIVIVESIYRMRAKGANPRVASVNGASEVGLAITTATLTTVVVFLPLMVMSGDVDLSFFLTKIGVPFVAALLGSLFVALIFIPLAAERFGGSEVKADPKSIRWARTGYHQALAWALTHRRDVALIAVALFATVLYPMEKVKKTDLLQGVVSSVRITGYPPKFLGWEELSDVGVEIEDFLESRKAAYGIQSVRFMYRTMGGSRLFFEVILEEEENREWWYQAYKGLRSWADNPLAGPMNRKAVIKDIRESMPKFVGHDFDVDQSGRYGRTFVRINLRGEDIEMLDNLLKEATFRVRTIPSVTSIVSNSEAADDEVLVLLDRKRMSRFGVSPKFVSESIAYQYAGVDLPRYRSDAREMRVRLYLNKLNRQSLHQLKNLTFPSELGERIPLSAFASFRVKKGDMRVYRFGGKLQLTLDMYATKDNLKGLYDDVDRVMADFKMPPGYSWDKGERYSRFKESEQTMAFAVILAITCVYLLMGVLFESFLLPFSVLFCIPFAFLGVYWTLYLTDTVMDKMAQVGIIVLIGVVVNNAIVLVDVVNRLRTEGKDRMESILEAGTSRFRPILMMTFTTVFGLVPMSLASDTLMGVPYSSMGRAMMGGLLCATPLTLFVVPLFYTYLDDLRTALHREMAVVLSQPSAIS